MSNKKGNKNYFNELLANLNSLSPILDHTDAFIFIKDIQGNYLYVNSDISHLFQKSFTNIIGKKDDDFFLTNNNDIKNQDNYVINNKIAIRYETEKKLKITGEVYTFQTIKNPLFDHNGDVIGIFGFSTDISLQKKLKKENKEQKYLLDIILNNVDAYIYMKDSNRYFRYVNQHVANLFGLPVKKIIGKLDTDVISKKDADAFWQSDKQVFEKNEKIIINETSLDANNKEHHYLSTKVPFALEDGTKALIGVSTDVTELYNLKESFETKANIDELTGLYNRRYFFMHAKQLFLTASRYRHDLSMITIDIDHFKNINDQYGHPAGDKALQIIGKMFQPMVRTCDIIARLGGEEFSILCPNTKAQQCKIVAERIRKKIDDKQFKLNKNTIIDIKVSLGISTLKSSDKSLDDIYDRADKALYRAKKTGRNKVCIIE